jgi:hypothetical protein
LGAIFKMKSNGKDLHMAGAGELRPIGDHPRYAQAAEKLARFNREIASVRKSIDETNAGWYHAQQPAKDDSAVAAADRMLDGRNDVDARDALVQLHDLNNRLGVLRAAASRQHEIVDQIRGELSVEAGKLVQARHRKALAKILEAARSLVQADAAERAIRGELLEHGYQALDTFTPAPRFAIPLSIGDESWFDSPISYFKRQLDELGIGSGN